MGENSLTLDAILAEKENQELRATLARRRERGRRRRERERKMARWKAAAVVALIIGLGLFVAFAGAAPADTQTPAAVPLETPTPNTTPEPTTEPPAPLLETAPTEWAEDPEDPLTAEETVAALLQQGYLSTAVPMSYEYQDYMRTYCAAYGCPYPLALAIAEVESRFDMDAVGALGEVGIMQLNPGPRGAYHAELERATGLDPTTPEGNIAGGCYLLGTYMQKYDDVAKAVMAYNMGESGARNAWAAGITSTAYSRTILEAVERWECTVNAWRGQ